MTEQLFKQFKKVLSKYINKINIDGITFSMTEYTDQKRIGGIDVQVPLIKIHNNKNVPFSYNSLHDLFSQELNVINDFTNHIYFHLSKIGTCHYFFHFGCFC